MKRYHRLHGSASIVLIATSWRYKNGKIRLLTEPKPSQKLSRAIRSTRQPAMPNLVQIHPWGLLGKQAHFLTIVIFICFFMLLSDITFCIFCCFWCVTHCVAINICTNCSVFPLLCSNTNSLHLTIIRSLLGHILKIHYVRPAVTNKTDSPCPWMLPTMGKCKLSGSLQLQSVTTATHDTIINSTIAPWYRTHVCFVSAPAINKSFCHGRSPKGAAKIQLQAASIPRQLLNLYSKWPLIGISLLY